MNHEQITIDYDRFFTEPVKERIRIFNEISAENRAFLVRTQAERWLAVNRFRLSDDQLSIVERVIESISPEWYKPGRDSEKPNPETESLVKKLEALLPREDVLQLATNRADYIPAVGDEEKGA